MDVTSQVRAVLTQPSLTRRPVPSAAAVAADHLRALGCAVAGVSTTGVAVDGQEGPLDRGIDCEIDWAGPVRLPLTDEAGVQAACGIMHVHGRRSGGPRALGVDYATITAGVLATQGVLAALIGRAREMPVRFVATSAGQAALVAVSQYLAAETAGDDEWTEPIAAGGPPFTSADGVRFEIETFDAGCWQRFWARLHADEPAVRRGWRPFQYRYATATCPLPDQLHAAAGRVDYATAVAAAAQSGISIMRVRRGTDHLTGDPPWRVIPMPGGTPAPATRPAAPAAPVAPVTPAAPSVGPADLPLDGVVVVEAGRRLQGPLAGHVLGLLGATVVRIEPPGGDPLRGMPPMVGDCSARFLAINHGKRVVEIDLKTPAGRAAVRDLVAQADVFLHNWAPGKAEELAMDAPDLAAARRGLVYAWASGWGAELGPRPPMGTDFMVQAYSGLAATVRPAEEPAPSLMTLTDILGGLVCVEGVLAALLTRIRTGRGQRVDSSLLSAASVLARSAHTPRHPPLPTMDGYLVLPENTRAQPRAMAAAFGFVRPPDPGELAARCVTEPTDTWLARLGDAGLVALPVCTDLRDLAADPRFASALRHDGCTVVDAPWEFA